MTDQHNTMLMPCVIEAAGQTGQVQLQLYCHRDLALSPLIRVHVHLSGQTEGTLSVSWQKMALWAPNVIGPVLCPRDANLTSKQNVLQADSLLMSCGEAIDTQKVRIIRALLHLQNSQEMAAGHVSIQEVPAGPALKGSLT